MAELQNNAEIYGNTALTKMFTSVSDSGRFCHAYLLYGQKGLGKRTLARRFAKSIQCVGKSKPCGECESCKKTDLLVHPDIVTLDAREGKNAVHIEEIRALRQDVYIRPNESEYKVYIIPNAQDMSDSAANALLKVLEEPPRYAVFILTATSKAAVLETILSRCIAFEVFPLDEPTLAAALRERFPNADEAALNSAAEVCDGNLGRAIDILSDENLKKIRAVSADFVTAMINRDEYGILKAATSANGSRADMAELLNELGTIVGDGLREPPDSRKTALCEKITRKSLCGLAELFEDMRYCVGTNVNMGALCNEIAASVMNII